VFRHRPEPRPEPVLFSSGEHEPESLIEPNSAVHKGRRIEKQTFVTVAAGKILNPLEQQFSNSLAAHARVHGHASDVQSRTLLIDGDGADDFVLLDSYPYDPVLNPGFYLALSRGSEIECFRCVSWLMFTKRSANKPLNRDSVATPRSSYLNEGFSSHLFVNLETAGAVRVLAQFFKELLELINPGNQAPGVGSVGGILGSKLKTQQGLFRSDPRQEGWNKERGKKEADSRTKS